MASSRGRYIPALDGLRAFAVLAVIAYHMGFPWASGGLLGVTVFFVLSGYLITGLLVAELRDTGTISLPQFWLRRVKRLFPAIVLVVAATALLCAVLNPALLTKMRPDIPSALFWFNNWWQVVHDVSYFEALGAPSPLAHFWSLAIEEQFYVLWPVIMLGVFKAGAPRAGVRRGILVAAAASAVWMAALFDPAADPSRVYYGTDTRAFSLLIGAWLAFVWPAGQLEEDAKIDPGMRLVLEVAGTAAFIGLVALVVKADGFSPFLYRGGLVLCSALTAVVIASISHPATTLGKIWSTKPLVWIGQRSYGMYLWHYPILLLMTDRNAASAPEWWFYLVELAVIFVFSAFSYTFVENPIRHGAIGKWVKAVRAGDIHPVAWLRERVVPAAACAVVLAGSAIGVAVVPDTAAIDNLEDLHRQADENQRQIEEQLADAEPDMLYDVVLIGDSVTVGAADEFERVFPTGLIDGAVNRQIGVAQTVYNYYRDKGIVGDVVIFDLGTNAGMDDDDIDALVNDVGSVKQIFFVTIRGPVAHEYSTNAAIHSAPARYSNVHVIDWYSTSEGHGEYFAGDGIHLTPEGAAVFVEMLRQSVGYVAPSQAASNADATPDATEASADDTEFEDARAGNADGIQSTNGANV